MDGNGNLSNDGNYYYSNFISVISGDTYVGWDGTHSMKYVTFFDINKNIVLSSNYNPALFTTPNIVLIPNNVAFVKITCFYLSGNINTFQFEAGTTPTTYEMFYI